FFVSPQSLFKVLDVVRDRLINWTASFDLSGCAKGSRHAHEAAGSTNVIHGSITATQVQMGSAVGSTFTVEGGVRIEEIRSLSKELDQLRAELELPAEALADLAADVDTLRAQVTAPKPKPSVIRECLQSVRRILESGTGGVLARLAAMAAGLA